ncbi:cysteine desulfurase [Candidatus Woesearchaeota archaeon]|nr:cysteine desulfurase [Candidatus Woesearchaeota archaeon]
MNQKKIYLDNAAATQTDIFVKKEMQQYEDLFYNPSSFHDLGSEAKKILENCRSRIANLLNASSQEIVFTSGGTESNNLAVKGIAFANKSKGNHIITTKIDHDSILNTCKYLEKNGFKVTYLDVDKEGLIDIEKLKSAITKDTILISVIYANNEIGTIQNIAEIGKIAQENNIIFHTDACQAYSLDLDVKKLNVSLLTLNSSKMHGPKGAGLLYIKKGTKIEPLIHGGEQEFNLRSGTENLQAIIGFAKAFELSQENKEQTIKNLTNLRDKLIKNILQILDVKLNGHQTLRLPNNVNVSIKGTESETLILHLNDFGIYVSSGSACSSNKIGISHVIKALKVPEEYARGTLRFTLSKYNTEEEIDHVSKMLNKIVNNLKPKLIEVQK